MTIDPSRPVDADLTRLVDEVFDDAMVAAGIRLPGAPKHVFGGKRRKYVEAEWIRDRRGRWVKYIGVPWKDFWKKNSTGREVPQFAYGGIYRSPFYGDQTDAGNADRAAYVARIASPRLPDGTVLIEIADRLTDLGRRPDPDGKTWDTIGPALPDNVPAGGSAFIRRPLGEDNNTFELTSKGRAVLEPTGPERRAELGGDRARLGDEGLDAVDIGGRRPRRTIPVTPVAQQPVSREDQPSPPERRPRRTIPVTPVAQQPVTREDQPSPQGRRRSHLGNEVVAVEDDGSFVTSLGSRYRNTGNNRYSRTQSTDASSVTAPKGEQLPFENTVFIEEEADAAAVRLQFDRESEPFIDQNGNLLGRYYERGSSFDAKKMIELRQQLGRAPTADEFDDAFRASGGTIEVRPVLRISKEPKIGSHPWEWEVAPGHRDEGGKGWAQLGDEELDAVDVSTVPERGAGFDAMGYVPLEYDPSDRQWQRRYGDHVTKAYQEYLKYMDRFGLGSDAMKFSDFLAGAGRVLRERMGREVRIQVPAKVLGAIINSQALKTQFETKSSMGLYSPDIRKESELELLGVPEDLPDHLRPVYGYVFQDGEKNRADRYGELGFTLADTVKARETLTGEDSLAKLSPATLRASLLEDASIESVLMAVSPSVVMRAALQSEGFVQPFRYHEVQIHGGLPLSEISQILVDEKDLTDSPGLRAATLRGMLDREGPADTLRKVFQKLGLPVEDDRFATAVRDVEARGDAVAAVEGAVNGFLLDSGNSLTKFSVNRGADQSFDDSLDAIDMGWSEDGNGDYYDEVGGEYDEWASMLEELDVEIPDEAPRRTPKRKKKPTPTEPLPNNISKLKQDFDTEVSKALLPYGFNVRTTFEKKNETIFGIEGQILDAGGNVVGMFEREIHEGFITNEKFKLNESVQGRGIGKKLTKAMNKAYLNNGYNIVRIPNANKDVGGYAWAKIGFDYDWGPDPLRFARDIDTDHMFELARKLFAGSPDYDPDEVIEYTTPGGIIIDPMGLVGKALDLLDKIRRDDPDLADALGRQFRDYIKRLYNPDPDPTKRVTPIELAEIGYTEGAGNWFGKELLTGDAAGWQGVMDIRKKQSSKKPVARLPEAELAEEPLDAVDIADAPRGVGWETLGYQPNEFNPENPGDRNNYQSLLDAVLAGFKFRATDIPEELTTKEGLAQYVAEAVREQLSGPIVVAAPRNVLGSIISGRAVKSQFETDMSRGMLDKDFRRTVERSVMGVPRELPDHLRPIYGYVSKPYTPAWVRDYGELEMTVADTVSHRATVTLGDSIVDQPARVLRNDRIGDASVESLLSTGSIHSLASLAAMKFQGHRYTDYSEVQINGGLPLKDITGITIKQRDVHFDEQSILTDPEGELSGLLRAWGVRPGKNELREAAATVEDRSTMLDAVERLVNSAIRRTGNTAVFRIDRGRARLQDTDLDAVDIDNLPDENADLMMHALHGDLNEAYIAAMRITDDALLAELVFKAKHQAIREIMVGRITDEEFLADIARRSSQPLIADTAVGRITDQSLLQDVAYVAKMPEVRWKAARMVTEKDLLEHLAKWSTDPNVRAEALRKVDDQSILEDALLNAFNTLPRIVAAERVQDQSVLQSVLGHRETTDELSAAVVKRLQDQTVLASVAVDDGYDPQSRLNAIGLIDDQAVLERLMLDEDELRAIRIAAAERVQDQEALKTFIGNFEDYWSSGLDKVTKKIKDQDFLLEKALAAESSSGLRTAAVDAIEDDESLLKVLEALDPANYSNNAPIEQALIRMKDQDKVFKFFTRPESVYRSAAAASVKDPNIIRKMLDYILAEPDVELPLDIPHALFENIAKNFPNHVGQPILHDFLEVVEDTSSFNLRGIGEYAIPYMTDQQLLMDLLKNSDKKNWQNILLQQVNDSDALADFVLSDADEFLRAGALNRISERSALDRVIGNAVQDEVVAAAEYRREKLKDLEPIADGIEKGIREIFESDNIKVEVKRNLSLGSHHSIFHLSGRFYDEEGMEIGHIERAIDGDVMEVENVHFEIDQEYQKGGKGKRLTKLLDKFYARNGITALRTIANIDVGAYAWTRLGFDFDWDRNGGVMFDALDDFEEYVKGKIKTEIAHKITAEEGFELRRKFAQLMKASRDPDVAKRPKPEDFALLGYVPGATDWFGKRMLIEGAQDIDLSWLGVKLISPAENKLKEAAGGDLDAVDVTGPLDTPSPAEAMLSESLAEAAADAADQFNAPAGWKIVPLGDGSSDPVLWRNPATGQRMVVKVGLDGKYEQLEIEVVASHLLRRIGLTAAPDVRINDRGTVVLMSHVDDAFPGGTPAVNWVKLTPEERLAAVNDFPDPRAGIRMLLADIALVNIDRHGGNVMVARDARGVAHLVPIDNGDARPLDIHRSPKHLKEFFDNVLKEAGHANLEIFNLSAEKAYNYFLAEYGNDQQQAFSRLREFFSDDIGSMIEEARAGGFPGALGQAVLRNLDFMESDRNSVVDILFDEFRQFMLAERAPQSELKDIALNHPDVEYRTVAARHLRDQEALEFIMVNDPDLEPRWEAVRNITNKAVRADYALNDWDENVRRNAVEGVDDQDILKEIIINDDGYDVRLAAIRNVKDQKFLEDLFFNANDWRERLVIIDAITDQDLLEKILDTDTNPDLDNVETIKAIGKITNLDVLKKFTGKKFNHFVKAAARRRIFELETPEDYSLDAVDVAPVRELFLEDSQLEAVAKAMSPTDAPPGWRAVLMDTGYSGPAEWRNLTTGERMIVKRGINDPYLDLEKEVIATEVLRRAGITATPFAAVNETGTVAVISHADDLFSDGPRATNWAKLTSSQRYDVVAEMPDPLDGLRMMVADIALRNTDRHPDNLMVKRDSTGRPFIVPIDHGNILQYPYDTMFSGADRFVEVQPLDHANVELFGMVMQRLQRERLVTNGNNETEAAEHIRSLLEEEFEHIVQVMFRSSVEPDSFRTYEQKQDVEDTLDILFENLQHMTDEPGPVVEALMDMYDRWKAENGDQYDQWQQSRRTGPQDELDAVDIGVLDERTTSAGLVPMDAMFKDMDTAVRSAAKKYNMLMTQKVQGNIITYTFRRAGKVMGTLQRELKITETPDGPRYWVLNRKFELDESLQGKKFGELVTKNLESMYERNGVINTQLTANIDVGAYAWAKKGFDYNWDEYDQSIDYERLLALPFTQWEAPLNQLFGGKPGVAGHVLDMTKTWSRGMRMLRMLRETDPKRYPKVRRDFEIYMRRMLQPDPDPAKRPTPAELAMIGYYPNAEMWFGKAVLSGPGNDVPEWKGIRQMPGSPVPQRKIFSAKNKPVITSTDTAGTKRRSNAYYMSENLPVVGYENMIYRNPFVPRRPGEPEEPTGGFEQVAEAEYRAAMARYEQEALVEAALEAARREAARVWDEDEGYRELSRRWDEIDAVDIPSSSPLDDLPVITELPKHEEVGTTTQGPDGVIVLEQSGELGQPKPPDEQLRYLYRSISEGEWEEIKRTGYIQSDGRMNLSADEGTVTDVSSPEWYLPAHPGVRGRTIRIRYNPEDGWYLDGRDSYVKTKQQVPADRIDAVTGWTYGTGTTSLPLEDAVQDIPYGISNSINNALIKAGEEADRTFDRELQDRIHNLRQKLWQIEREQAKQLRDADFNRIPFSMGQIEEYLDTVEREIPAEFSGAAVAGGRDMLLRLQAERESIDLDAVDVGEAPRLWPGDPFPKDWQGVSWQPVDDLLELAGNLAPDAWRRSRPGELDRYRRFTNIDAITEDMKKNGYLENFIIVQYNPETGDVALGEGNHRLEAARRAGMTHIPVVMDINRHLVDSPTVSLVQDVGRWDQDHFRFNENNLREVLKNVRTISDEEVRQRIDKYESKNKVQEQPEEEIPEDSEINERIRLRQEAQKAKGRTAEDEQLIDDILGLLDAVDVPEGFDYNSLTLGDVQLINDPVALAAVAENSANSRVRIVAVERITDQQVLMDLASRTAHGDVRRAAMRRLVNQQALANLVRGFDDPLMQATAVYNMTDESLLRGLLDTVEDPQVKFLIVNKIHDQDVLLDIVASFADGAVLEPALRQVEDQSVLFDVAVDPPSDEVGSAALANIEDPDLLRRLVSDSSNPVVAEQAAEKIKYQEEMENLRTRLKQQLENSENNEGGAYRDEDEDYFSDEIDELVVSVMDEAEAAVAKVAEQYGLAIEPYDQVSIGPNSYQFGFALFDEESNVVGKLERGVDGENRFIENSLFMIDKSRQGKGFGRAVTEALEEVYRKNGIKKIVLTANIDVGAYAWAKQGFKFDWEKAINNVPFKTREGDFSDYAYNKLQQMVKEGRLTGGEAEQLEDKFTELMETLEWHGPASDVEPIDFALLGYDESKDVEDEDYTWFGKELLIGAGKEIGLSWKGVKNLETTDEELDAADIAAEAGTRPQPVDENVFLDLFEAASNGSPPPAMNDEQEEIFDALMSVLPGRVTSEEHRRLKAKRKSYEVAAVLDAFGANNPPLVLSAEDFENYEGEKIPIRTRVRQRNGRYQERDVEQDEFWRSFRMRDVEFGRLVDGKYVKDPMKTPAGMVHRFASDPPGENYIGIGDYGDGTYIGDKTAASFPENSFLVDRATGTTIGPDAAVVRMKLKPGTRLIDWDNIPPGIRNLPGRGLAAWVLMSGYHGINATRGNDIRAGINILDRSRIVMDYNVPVVAEADALDAVDISAAQSSGVTGRMREAAAGAEVPSDVPDGWEGQRTATGASEPYVWTDAATGQRMIVKKSLNGNYPPLEKELIGAQVLRGIGLDDTPEAVVNDLGTVVMVRHAGDRYPAGQRRPDEWASLGPQEKAALAAQLADPWDAVRLLLGDVALINEDRNPGNLMIGSDSDGKLRLFPIDHGSTLRRAYVPEAQFDPSFSREPGGASYDTSRASPQGYIRNRRSRHGQISHDLARIVLDSIYQDHLERAGGDAGAARAAFIAAIEDNVGAIIDRLGNVQMAPGDRVYTPEQQAIRDGTMRRMLANIATMQQQQAGIVAALVDLFDERQSWPGWAAIFNRALRGSGDDRRSGSALPGVEDVLGVTDGGGVVVVGGFPSGGGGVGTFDGGEEGVVVGGHPVFEVHLPPVFDHRGVVGSAEDGPGRWVVLVGDDRDERGTGGQR